MSDKAKTPAPGSKVANKPSSQASMEIPPQKPQRPFTPTVNTSKPKK